jgi:uncharacterized phage-associated protein
MSKVKFPKRHRDNSFCVTATFSIITQQPETLLDGVKNWLLQWTENNGVWVRNWSNGKVEKLLYQQEFKTAPHPISCTLTELKIVLEGQPLSEKLWKDWLALRIIPELKNAFSEIQDFQNVIDCD